MIEHIATRSTDNFLCVDPSRAAEIWPHVEPLLREACEYCGGWSVDKIRDDALTGLQLLWITWNGTEIKAVITTRLLREDKGLVCEAVACGGEGSDWQQHIQPIEQYARDEGCATARVMGRPGWARVFSGYKTKLVLLEKRLD